MPQRLECPYDRTILMITLCKSIRFSMKSTLLYLSVLLLAFCSACQPASDFDTDDPMLIHRSMKKLTDVIVYDIFSPPVASRIYAYPSIAAYEALIHAHPGYQTLASQLNGLEAVPNPEADQEYSYPLASLHAFLTVGKALIFSEQDIEELEQEIYGQYEDALSGDVYDRSMDYGRVVADHILAWANEDNYKESRSYPKFTVNDAPGRWQPTPPDYMDGIEPHWSSIRPFVLDSANQFVPPPPVEFSLDEGSEFRQQLMEVYETGKQLDDEQTEVASFWDCNPYVSHHQGHVMFATKKITPGGHWIGIASIAARQTGADLMKSVETYALTSIALMDGFISCWDEKYRSSLIRPETLINIHVDEDWVPLLQTPPFPEYTSGHSVISSAAAVALTDLYGDNFAFTDSTEYEYGLPPRDFPSFLKASEEAAISRLYGGIHYMMAIENGVDQGRDVGNFVISNLQMRKEEVAEK